MEQKIPKIIHYCWFGRNPKTKLMKKCIKSWKEKCAGYQIIEWNEDNFDINTNTYCKEAYEMKRWAFVSDYVRFWVLNEYGGIYFDTDVEVIKSIDELLVYDGFFCTENGNLLSTGLGCGCVKGNRLIQAILKDYEGLNFINEGKMDLTPCTKRNTITINHLLGKTLDFNQKQCINNMIFLPKDYFSPLDYDSYKLHLTENSFAIHWYSESWLSPMKKIRKKCLRVLRNLIGKEKYEFLKNKCMKE